jgi:hypothetical protein
MVIVNNRQLKKYVSGLLVIIFIAACGGSDSDKKDSPVVNDSSALKSYVKLDREDLDKTNFCPVNGAEHHKEFHIVYLLDTTMRLSKPEFATINNLLLYDKKSPQSIEDFKRAIPPYTKVSIVNLDGQRLEASETGTLFSMCRPRTGDGPYDADKLNELFENSMLVKQDWKTFIEKFETAKSKIAAKANGSFTQLFEMILEISRMSQIGFSNVAQKPGQLAVKNWDQRKLIIASDLLHQVKGNQDARLNIDLFDACYKEQNKKGTLVAKKTPKCPTWNQFYNSEKKNLLDSLKPQWGPNPPSVEILFLHRTSDPLLNMGLREFWIDYLKWTGIKNIEFQYESNKG